MPKLSDPFKVVRSLKNDGKRFYYSLPELEAQGMGKISRLPVSIRIMLESLLRNCDGIRVKEEDVKRLANYNAVSPKGEVPFIVSRVILQDFTGVPLLVDLAAMRDAVAKKNFDPGRIEPNVPVDLVVDHSVQVDRAGTADAFIFNLGIEFQRNRERYEFLKWGQEAFEKFKVIPPGIGIVHQVNLEHLAKVVDEKEVNGNQLLFPDTLVGTDSHTTMINGLGVVGWGVGGIEAEAAMLDQPVGIQAPEVIGVHMTGRLKEGVTATDLTLFITELLRKEKVVDKFVEFFGEGAASLNIADRATIGNMAPEYGATIGYFPPDDKTLEYMQMTGRDEALLKQVKEYLVEQNLFGIPRKGQIDYTKVLELDLNKINPCVSGPKRPQDRIELPDLKNKFKHLLQAPVTEGGYGKIAPGSKVCIHSGGHFSLNAEHVTGGIETLDTDKPVPLPRNEAEMVTNRPITEAVVDPGYSDDLNTLHGHSITCETVLRHGSIVIAAITSCTNTSNPHVMIGAGLLAKKAVEKGLTVSRMIKTSLAPGSRVVTDYLDKTGLQTYLNQLGFDLVGYGCTTCIGNSGPLDERIESAIKEHDLIAVSVLSGNRNFEARIHGAVKANFLMSPPLVVAYAIAGRIDIDMDQEPLGYDREGQPVFLRDIWPKGQEIQREMARHLKAELFQTRYKNIAVDNPLWDEIHSVASAHYSWDQASTYIQKPPFFEHFELQLPPLKSLKAMRPLAFFGDSVTTDHISPAGAFKKDTPAGQYLLANGVNEHEFNSYGSRRGNHHVMMRGTFANVRIRNQMAEGKEGGFTKLMPEGKLTTIFEASEKYAERQEPLIVFAGRDYGMGSSRDWAAKGPALLGVRVVVAKSFERIHRSNLIGMGILPLEFKGDDSLESLELSGEETFNLTGFEEGFSIHQDLTLEIKKGENVRKLSVKARLDTPIEIEYYRHGGILPFVLRQVLTS